MNRISRRVFTGEFKAEAVKLVTEQGVRKSEVARRLDVSLKSLDDWIKQSKAGVLKGSLGVGKLTAEQQRIRELERELAIARMERDILKKATAFFAREERSEGCRGEVRLDR